MIDWQELLEGVNTRRRKEGLRGFATLRKMLNHFYHIEDLSPTAIGKQLGVSSTSVVSKIAEEGLTMKSHGGFRWQTNLYPEKFGFKTEREMLKDFRYTKKLSISQIHKKLLEETEIVCCLRTVKKRLKACGLLFLKKEVKKRQLANTRFGGKKGANRRPYK